MGDGQTIFNPSGYFIFFEESLINVFVYNEKVDNEMLRFYRNRWQAIKEIEILEARQATVSTRWVQLNALAGLARTLNIVPSHDSHDEIVRARWNQLREFYS